MRRFSFGGGSGTNVELVKPEVHSLHLNGNIQ